MKINYILLTSLALNFVSCKVTDSNLDMEDDFDNEFSVDDTLYDYYDDYYDDNYYDYNFDEEFESQFNVQKHSSKELLIDLLHTKLEVSFNWEESKLNGIATLKCRPHFYPQNQLELDAKGMDIIKVMINGKECKYDYSDSLKLKIDLDKFYSVSDEFIAEIEYIAKPNERETSGSYAITSDKGLYFINPKGEQSNKMPQIWTQGETEASSVWFPTIDAPNIKTTQEIYITVDEKYITLSNGRLKSSVSNKKGMRTDYWVQNKPHAPYLFMMAVGEFSIINDFYIRKDGSKMEVNYYVEPAYKDDAKHIFGETPEMIKYFSELLGIEYQWDKYSQIVVRDYVSGAMENTGAVVFGDFVYKNKRELIDENDQSTIAHELFHHWFGDLVTCESWSNLPLNESFANYSQYLWDEYKYGRDEADFMAENEADGYFRSTSYQGYHDLIWFDYYDKEEMFDAHSYNKGGRILHMLRNHLGDEAFFKGLNKYLQDNKFKSAEYNQLRLAFEEVTGQDLNWFFDQWFLGKGHPVLFVDYDLDKYNNTIKVKVNQMQNAEFPTFKIPVKLGVWDGSGYRIEKIVLEEKEQIFEISFNGELKNILFDHDEMILGRLYENKSSKWFLNQLLYDKSNYRSRIRAIKRLEGSKEYRVGLETCLKDKHWSLRSLAVDGFAKMLYFSNEIEQTNIIEILFETLKKETNSKVQSKIINVLGDYKFENSSFDEILKSTALGLGSYLTQQSSLIAITNRNEEVFEMVIDSLLNRNDLKEKMMLCDVISQTGQEKYYSILEEMATENSDDQLKFRSFISLLMLVTQAQEQGDRYDWFDKIVNLYILRLDNNSSLFESYGWRITSYLDNVLSGIIELLNQQIADVNTDNRNELLDLKEKYEKLLLKLHQ